MIVLFGYQPAGRLVREHETVPTVYSADSDVVRINVFQELINLSLQAHIGIVTATIVANVVPQNRRVIFHQTHVVFQIGEQSWLVEWSAMVYAHVA